MERQRFSKPYAARFWLYRFLTGGTWKKYGYNISCSRLSPPELDGWYWTRDNMDHVCEKSVQLTKLKEKTYKGYINKKTNEKA